MSDENDKPTDPSLEATQSVPAFTALEEDGGVKVFGLGYKQDEPDDRDYPLDRLLGAPGSATPEPASVMEYRHGYLAQGGAGSCVAHAIDRAVDVNLRFNLAQNGHVGVHPPKLSRRFMYFNARQAENVDLRNAGRPTRPVEDVGSYPRLAMRAIQKLGFCAEEFFKYTDDPQLINETPPPEAYGNAYDQKDLRYYRIASVGMTKIADLSRALKRGCGVVFGMFVDTEFMRNRGQRITSVNENDSNGGGHMMTVLAVEWNQTAQEWDVIFDNWWTDQWGERGIGRMSADAFIRHATDVYAIEAAPFFSSGAA